jgi:hypothetical protein
MMLKNKFISTIWSLCLCYKVVLFIKTAITLDEAAASNRKTLITKTDGAKLKVKSRTNRWNLYGIAKVEGKTEKLFW